MRKVPLSRLAVGHCSVNTSSSRVTILGYRMPVTIVLTVLSELKAPDDIP